MRTYLRVTLLLGAVFFVCPRIPPAQADSVPPAADPAQRQHAEELSQMPPVPASHGVHVDNSGRKEKGHASFYAQKFSNRKMANGRRMNPDTNNAASKQL